MSAPTITSVSPNEGPITGGTTVLIVGTNFQDSGGNDIVGVSLGGQAVSSLNIVDANRLSFATPAGAAGASTITIVNTSTGASVTSAFTYIGPPTFTSISPTSGTEVGGTAVTITGTGFVSGYTSVNVGAAALTSISVSGTTTITGTTARNLVGAADIRISRSSDGQTVTASNAYTFLQAMFNAPTANASMPLTVLTAQNFGTAASPSMTGWTYDSTAGGAFAAAYSFTNANAGPAASPTEAWIQPDIANNSTKTMFTAISPQLDLQKGTRWNGYDPLMLYFNWHNFSATNDVSFIHVSIGASATGPWIDAPLMWIAFNTTGTGVTVSATGPVVTGTTHATNLHPWGTAVADITPIVQSSRMSGGTGGVYVRFTIARTGTSATNVGVAFDGVSIGQMTSFTFSTDPNRRRDWPIRPVTGAPVNRGDAGWATGVADPFDVIVQARLPYSPEVSAAGAPAEADREFRPRASEVAGSRGPTFVLATMTRKDAVIETDTKVNPATIGELDKWTVTPKLSWDYKVPKIQVTKAYMSAGDATDGLGGSKLYLEFESETAAYIGEKYSFEYAGVIETLDMEPLGDAPIGKSLPAQKTIDAQVPAQPDTNVYEYEHVFPWGILRAVTQSFGELAQLEWGVPVTRLIKPLGKMDTWAYVESTLGFPASGAVYIGDTRYTYAAKTTHTLQAIVPDVLSLVSRPNDTMVVLDDKSVKPTLPEFP